MNKTRQKELTRWLKQQSVISQRWLNISRLLGFVSGLLIVAQAWLMARILDHMIMANIPREALLLPFIVLVLIFILRAWVVWLRERVGFLAGQHIRFEIRRQVLDRLQQAGPAWIQGKPAGSWATLILEQIDDMHDYYARYLPQMALAVSVPLLIVVAIFPSNWAAALILLGTAPLIPLFMALVGMGAADANRRNFLALARLSGHFLDRLRGVDHQVEENLIELERKAFDLRECRILLDDIRLVLDLVEGDIERAVEALVDVRHLPGLGVVHAREILEVLDDSLDALQTAERLGEQVADVAAQIVEEFALGLDHQRAVFPAQRPLIRGHRTGKGEEFGIAAKGIGIDGVAAGIGFTAHHLGLFARLGRHLPAVSGRHRTAARKPQEWG